MGRLAAAFLAARQQRDGAVSNAGVALTSERGGGDATGEPADLEATLAGLLARGAATHPDLSLDEVQFAIHLGRCGAPVHDVAPGALHAEDLFLAAAAL